MAVSITMKELLEAGVHFGHQTKRWNPKMKKYIFGKRNGIYIIDLQKTLRQFKEASKFVTDLAAAGKNLLFVGTKRQAMDAIYEEANRCGMFYVNTRWLGGTLTNFSTIRKSIHRLKEIEGILAQDDNENLTKKERLRLEREKEKLEKNLTGIKEMDELPDALFVIDPKQEYIAVKEANILGIPVVAVVDTNCDPDLIDHVIPGNDDAIRAIRLLCSLIAEACIEGQQERANRAAAEPEPEVAVAAEPEYDESASDELVAALAGGAALTFSPDEEEEDDLLPGARPVTEAPAPVVEATPDEIAAELAREAAEKEEPATAV